MASHSDAALNSAAPPSPARAWLSVGILSICYVFSLLDRLIISLLVEPMKQSLSLSDVQIGLLQGPAFAIFYATAGVFLGRLADRVNRRDLVAWAIAFWGLCTAASGLARGFAALFVARVGVGAGEAALTPAAYSIIGDSVRSDRQGGAMGIYTAGGAVGSGVALLIGGAVYRQFESMESISWPIVGSLAPWQATLVAVGLPGVLLALCVRALVIEPPRTSQASQASFVAVLATIRQRGLFYFPAFAAYSAITGLAYAFVSWVPSFLARTFALGPAEVGASFGPVMLVAGLVGPILAGAAADRLNASRGRSAPFVVMKAMLLLLTLATILAFQADGFVAALIGCGIVGFLATGLLGLQPLALQLATPSHMRGQVAGVNLMIGNLLGLGLGPLSVALLTQHVIADGSLGTALTWVIVSLAAAALLFGHLAGRAGAAGH